MKLDLRPMLKGNISRLDVNFTLDKNNVQLVDASIVDAIRVEGNIIDTAGYMRMTLSVEFDYSGECARCLEKVDDSFKTEFVRTVVDDGTLTDEQLNDNIDEYAIISDGFLDVDEQLCEAIIFDFPSKLLCSDDCLGLCQKCGKPKKNGDCGCDFHESNPRWAKLKDFLNN